jgi:hypothetical protein
MLTGQVPFEELSAEVMHQHQHAPYRLNSKNPHSRSFSSRCPEKDRERFPEPRAVEGDAMVRDAIAQGVP